MLPYYLSLVDTEEEKSKLESLYYEYKALMKYIASGILKDDCLAEDAVHEAFIKLARHLNGISEIQSYKTKAFIVIVIRNVALDMLDKEKNNRIHCLEEIVEVTNFRDDILENMNIEEIYSVLISLPYIHRDIIQLKVYYELSDKEISDILGISNCAVRKRLQRARNYLKNILAERGAC